MVKVIVDEQKGFDMFEKLNSAYYNREGIFQFSHIVPEMKVVNSFEIGSHSHCSALFIGTLLDSLRSSERVYRAARTIVMNYNNNDLIDLGVRGIEKIMDRVHDNGIGKPADILHRASIKLDEICGGDPRIFFDGINNYDEAKSKLLMFYGIGHGKANLMIKNFVRFDYFVPENIWDVPIKIDRHAMRISIGNGVVAFDEEGDIHVSNFVPVLDKLYRKILQEGHFDPVLIDDLKYIVGSQLCVKKDINMCKKYCPLNCEQMVDTDKSNSYVVIPSDVRVRDYLVSGNQLSLYGCA
jgi:hypothetical protein